MKFNVKSLPKGTFSSSYLLGYFNDQFKLTEIGEDIFLIGAVVADRGIFCYYKSGQHLLQMWIAFCYKSTQHLLQIGAQQFLVVSHKIV